MTSNVGAELIRRETRRSASTVQDDTDAQRATEQYERMKDKVLNELKKLFRPEFLNRIDATVVFRALTARRSATSST